MNRYVAVGLVAFAGLSLAAVGDGALKAQPKAAGAYAVLEISEVSDPELFKQVVLKAKPVVEAAGGRYVARTDKITPLAGSPPNRMVIIAFDSVDAAKAWFNGAAQTELNAMGDRAYKSRWFIVEGSPD